MTSLLHQRQQSPLILLQKKGYIIGISFLDNCCLYFSFVYLFIFYLCGFVFASFDESDDHANSVSLKCRFISYTSLGEGSYY